MATEHGYTICSPCAPNVSGELKRRLQCVYFQSVCILLREAKFSVLTDCNNLCVYNAVIQQLLMVQTLVLMSDCS